MAAWAVISLSLAAMLLFAMARLRREQRGWNDGIVGGAPVWLSDSLGPAAVGIWRPRVVLPAWVLALDDSAQRAIVAHEAEHQRMHDPALLVWAASWRWCSCRGTPACGWHGAGCAMPWNSIATNAYSGAAWSAPPTRGSCWARGNTRVCVGSRRRRSRDRRAWDRESNI